MCKSTTLRFICQRRQHAAPNCYLLDVYLKTITTQLCGQTAMCEKMKSWLTHSKPSKDVCVYKNAVSIDHQGKSRTSRFWSLQRRRLFVGMAFFQTCSSLDFQRCGGRTNISQGELLYYYSTGASQWVFNNWSLSDFTIMYFDNSKLKLLGGGGREGGLNIQLNLEKVPSLYY